MKEILNSKTAIAKAGYKKTKLGWIPEDWSVKSLDELGEFSKGKGIAKKDVLEDETDGLPCVRYAEIYTLYHYNTITLKSKINKESAENSNPINYGDILFAGSGETLEDIGKSIAYLGVQKAYAGGDIIILKQENQDSRYLGYLFNNDVVKSQLFKIGQGHSVVHIYSSGLKKVLVALPPLPEQQKIASIINTWDKAITAQEKLMAEKQELKNGLMQQLLTGKKRFDEFIEGWTHVKLGKLATIKAGGTPSKAKPEYWGGNIRWMNSGELNLKKVSEVEGRINEVGLKNSSANLLPKHCVLIGLAGQGKTRGTAAINLVELCTNQSVAAILPSKGFNSFFMYYLIDSKYELLRQLSAGDGGRGGLNLGILNSIKISIPNIKEQEKIVSVLSNADNNINKAKEKLSVMKKLKRGLMQQLLTGEKRVKI